MEKMFLWDADISEDGSLFSSPTSSLQEKGVILVRIDETNPAELSFIDDTQKTVLSGESSLQGEREHPTFSCLALEAFCFQVSRVWVFLFLSNSSSKGLWYFLLFTRLHWFLLNFVFVKWS